MVSPACCGASKASPGTIRLRDDRTPRGYTLAAFKDAFKRYLGEDREAATGTDDPTGGARE